MRSAAICSPSLPGARWRPSIWSAWTDAARVNYCGILSEGTLDSVPVFVRQIVEKVLAVHASFVIMAHNHPSGFALPSRADIDTTREVIRALGPLSVSVVDHIVVSGEDCVSFRDSGFLNR